MRLVSTSRHLSSMKASQRRAVDSSPALSRHSATFSIRLRMNRGTWRRNAARKRWPCSKGLERSQRRHHRGSMSPRLGCKTCCTADFSVEEILQKQAGSSLVLQWLSGWPAAVWWMSHWGGSCELDLAPHMQKSHLAADR